jgi:hypothetical protein
MKHKGNKVEKTRKNSERYDEGKGKTIKKHTVDEQESMDNNHKDDEI